jgi:hypothetical protein
MKIVDRVMTTRRFPLESARPTMPDMGVSSVIDLARHLRAAAACALPACAGRTDPIRVLRSD